MIALMLGLAACQGPSAPTGLVEALSGYHDVPPVEALAERFDGLEHHLRTLTTAADTAPHARTRAWELLASTEGGRPDAIAAVADPDVAPVIRYKILRRLAETHAATAISALRAIDCGGSSVLVAGTRRVAEELSQAGHTVPPPCGGR